MSKKKLIFDDAGWLSDEITKLFREYAGIDLAADSSQDKTATQIMIKQHQQIRMADRLNRDLNEIEAFFDTMPQIDCRVTPNYRDAFVVSSQALNGPLIISTTEVVWQPFFGILAPYDLTSKVRVKFPAGSWKRALLLALYPEKFLASDRSIPEQTRQDIIEYAQERRTIRTFAVVAAIEKTITY